MCIRDRFCIASVHLLGPLLFSERACRRQLALMDRFLPEEMRYPEEIKAYYLQDMPKLPRETLYAMYRTYMMQYRLKESVRDSGTQVMYWYGEKEMRCVKESARLFQSKMCIRDRSKTVAATVQMAVQVGGKVRANIVVPTDSDEAAVVASALAEPKIARMAEGMDLVKSIVVKGRLVNLIFKPKA